MDKVIVTGLLAVGAVTVAVAAILALAPSISRSSQSVAESTRAAADRMGTNIEIIAVAVDSNGETIDAWVKNVGVARIDAIYKSDLFLIQRGTRFESLPYSGDTPGPKFWYGDLQESGDSWSRGDTLHVTARLPTAEKVLANIDYVLGMSTPNGISAYRTFAK